MHSLYESVKTFSSRPWKVCDISARVPQPPFCSVTFAFQQIKNAAEARRTVAAGLSRYSAERVRMGPLYLCCYSYPAKWRTNRVAHLCQPQMRYSFRAQAPSLTREPLPNCRNRVGCSIFRKFLRCKYRTSGSAFPRASTKAAVLTEYWLFKLSRLLASPHHRLVRSAGSYNSHARISVTKDRKET